MADSPPAALIEAIGSPPRGGQSPRREALEHGSPRHRGQSPVHRSTGTQDGSGGGGSAARLEKEEEVVLLLVVAAAVAAAYWHRRAQRRRQYARLNALPQRRRRPRYIYVPREFSLEAMPPGNVEFEFRFAAHELRRILPLLRLEDVAWRTRVHPPAMTALCVLCARLSYPKRWPDLSKIFGRSEGWLSTVFNDTVLFLVARFGPLLWWHPQLTYRWLEAFSEGVERVTGAGGVWGFVDGTFRSHCRPQGNVAQRAVYSGHKRLHGINYQAICTPDGLISSFTGPWAGPVNDWAMWKKSGYEAAMRTVSSPFFVLPLLSLS